MKVKINFRNLILFVLDIFAILILYIVAFNYTLATISSSGFAYLCDSVMCYVGIVLFSFIVSIMVYTVLLWVQHLLTRYYYKYKNDNINYEKDTVHYGNYQSSDFTGIVSINTYKQR